MQNKRGAALLDKGERAFKVEPNAYSMRDTFYAPLCPFILCMEPVTASVAGTEGRQESGKALRPSLSQIPLQP